MENFSQHLASSFFRSTTHAIIFFVCIAVSSCVLLFYAKRHPHPRFRPKLGEVTLIGLIFLGISVVITGLTANLFDQENIDASAKKLRDRAKDFKREKAVDDDPEEEEGDSSGEGDDGGSSFGLD